jgi:hypothetical protein
VTTDLAKVVGADETGVSVEVPSTEGTSVSKVLWSVLRKGAEDGLSLHGKSMADLLESARKICPPMSKKVTLGMSFGHSESETRQTTIMTEEWQQVIDVDLKSAPAKVLKMHRPKDCPVEIKISSCP